MGNEWNRFTGERRFAGEIGTELSLSRDGLEAAYDGFHFFHFAKVQEEETKYGLDP